MLVVLFWCKDGDGEEREEEGGMSVRIFLSLCNSNFSESRSVVVIQLNASSALNPSACEGLASAFKCRVIRVEHSL